MTGFPFLGIAKEILDFDWSVMRRDRGATGVLHVVVQ